MKTDVRNPRPNVGLMRAAARVIEATTRRDLVQLGLGWGGSFALVNRADRDQAWFSQRHQLQTVLQRCNVDLVIDVGANEGQFATWIRRFYPGPIVSFEPVSASFEKLYDAAASDPNWYAHKVALGAENAEMAIHVSDYTVFSSLLHSNEFGAARFGAESVPSREEIATVKRLDRVLDDMAAIVSPERIFLKLDTQGYDTKVFEGLGQWVNHVVAMQSEVSLIPIYADMPHWTESISLYEASGFGVVGLFPVSQDDDGRVIEFDCLLQRATKPALEHVP